MFTFFLWKPIYERFYRTEKPSNSIPVSFLNEDTYLSKVLASFSEIGAIVTIGMLTLYIVLYAKRNVLHKKN